MATTPETETDKHSIVGAEARELVVGLRRTVAGPVVPFRTVVIALASLACTAMAPVPFNILGVIFIGLLLIDISSKRK